MNCEVYLAFPVVVGNRYLLLGELIEGVEVVNT